MKTFEGKLVSKSIKVGIVAARFNEFITSKLLSGALDGPLDGLFDILRGQNAKENGHAAFQRNGGDSLGNLVADVVIVAGGTAE